MLTNRRIAVVGSREFQNYKQVEKTLLEQFVTSDEDEIISGGAVGVDSMAQRFCKEQGLDLSIKYPKYKRYGRGATFVRNERIARASELVVAFYRKGHFQEGGTANTAEWARKLGIELYEFEEE